MDLLLSGGSIPKSPNGRLCLEAGKSTLGVPQGSALSPLLFNIYLQPLIYALAKTDCQVFNYADDTPLIVRIDNTSATQGNVQNII